jgi:predicted transcriptional regulator of viral defense system
VYFVEDRPFTDAAHIRAAVWSYGPSATASALSAAWWHGVTKYAPDVVDVTVPRDSNGRRHSGSRVRRRDLSPADVVERKGLRVTGLPLTVVEAAVRRGGGAKLMDSALQRHVDLAQLWRAHLRNKGRYGSPAARRLLQAASDGAR